MVIEFDWPNLNMELFLRILMRILELLKTYLSAIFSQSRDEELLPLDLSGFTEEDMLIIFDHERKVFHA